MLHVDCRTDANLAEDHFVQALKKRKCSLFNVNSGGGGPIGRLAPDRDENGKQVWLHNPKGYTIYLAGKQVEEGQKYTPFGVKIVKKSRTR